MSSSLDAKPVSRKPSRPARGWRIGQRIRLAFAATPPPIRIVVIAAAVLVGLFLANIIYQVIRKPTELLFFVGHSLDKVPTETWRQYGPLFRTYSTNAITPELLAALAQVESTGNPVARTYWRWRWSPNPLAIYKPASSAVGLYQMTDPAYAHVARYCIRNHAVTDTDCGSRFFYFRAWPSHAIELTAVSLHRHVAAVLARTRNTANAQQKQDLAAFVHLCGPSLAPAFAKRGFRPMAAERCGDHLVTVYIAKVNAMKKTFQRLAVNDQS